MVHKVRLELAHLINRAKPNQVFITLLWAFDQLFRLINLNYMHSLHKSGYGLLIQATPRQMSTPNQILSRLNIRMQKAQGHRHPSHPFK